MAGSWGETQARVVERRQDRGEGDPKQAHRERDTLADTGIHTEVKTMPASQEIWQETRRLFDDEA